MQKQYICFDRTYKNSYTRPRRTTVFPLNDSEFVCVEVEVISYGLITGFSNLVKREGGRLPSKRSSKLEEVLNHSSLNLNTVTTWTFYTEIKLEGTVGYLNGYKNMHITCKPFH